MGSEVLTSPSLIVGYNAGGLQLSSKSDLGPGSPRARARRLCYMHGTYHRQTRNQRRSRLWRWRESRVCWDRGVVVAKCRSQEALCNDSMFAYHAHCLLGAMDAGQEHLSIMQDTAPSTLAFHTGHSHHCILCNTNLPITYLAYITS